MNDKDGNIPVFDGLRGFSCLLVDKGTLTKMWVMRKILAPMGPMDGIEFLLEKLGDTKTNDEFFDKMNS